MGFSRLTEELVDKFAEAPEVHMSLQIGRRRNGEIVLVVSGRLALTIDESLIPQMRDLQQRMESDLSPSDAGDRMKDWLVRLEPTADLRPLSRNEALAALGFLHLGPRRQFTPPPTFRAAAYGHLPFHGICSGQEVFYRYEPYPTSIRIDQSAGRVIKAGTFASPLSELPFIPTGLAAVARYALPSLLPARWRWELRPERGTPAQYGACVPMHGQSGGGVEVMFTRPFDNIGPIANPVVLPVF
jgi:hypothetical protein